MLQIEHVRFPDELKFALSGICDRFPKIASLDDDASIKLSGLTMEEQVALDFLRISAPVDEIIDNINMVLSDLEMLGRSARAFGDNHPFRRYKLLVRTFFYEFGRFEDAFAYYTLWLQRRRYISKEQRKVMRADFYSALEPMINVRNICVHAEPDWRKHVTPEITILKGLDLFGLQVADIDGAVLRWEPHLGPQCTKTCAMIETACSEMRTTWNMHFARCAEELIRDGKIRAATRRYVPKKLVRSRVRDHQGKRSRTGDGN